jgi:hypothetical protein
MAAQIHSKVHSPVHSVRFSSDLAFKCPVKAEMDHSKTGLVRIRIPTVGAFVDKRLTLN